MAAYVPLILQQGDFRTDDYVLLAILDGVGLPSPFSGVQYPFFSAFRVLPMLALQVDLALYGPSAWGYYAFNLLVHVGSAVLMFLLLRLVFAWYFAKDAPWLAFLLSLALGLHADLFYNALWICNRTEGMLLLFTLGAAYAWLRYVRDGMAGWYLAGLFATGLALLTKEQALHLPLLYLLIGLVAASDGRRAVPLRRVLLGALPLVAMAAALLALRWLYDPGATHFLAFLSPRKALSLVGINLIAFHPTLAKPLFVFFVEHKPVAAVIGLALLVGAALLLRRASPRARRVALVLFLLLLATSFPRVLYHVFNRINSVQVAVLLVFIGVALLHLRPRWRTTLATLLLAAQVAGIAAELPEWRRETGNERYRTLLEEEARTGSRRYLLLTYYHHLAPYVMHFQRHGSFGYDSSMSRVPLVIDRRYGSHTGPEFTIAPSGEGYELRSTDPRSVFLLDEKIDMPAGFRVRLSEAAPDYGYYRAWLQVPPPPANTVYLIERNVDFEKFEDVLP